MFLETNHSYRCTIKAKLPFPVGAVEAQGTMLLTDSRHFTADISAKGHSRHMEGTIEDGTYTLTTSVKGLPAGAVFTIDDKGAIDGSAYAWKFKNVAISGNVENG